MIFQYLILLIGVTTNKRGDDYVKFIHHLLCIKKTVNLYKQKVTIKFLHNSTISLCLSHYNISKLNHQNVSKLNHQNVSKLNHQNG